MKEGYILAPITSRGVDQAYPFEVIARAGETDPGQDSKVLLDQIRSVDKQRLGRRIGALSAERLLEVDRALRLSLEV